MWVVGGVAVLGTQRHSPLAIEAGQRRDLRAPEVDRAGALVGPIHRDQRAGQLHDVGDVVASARLVGRAPYPQRGHVPAEEELLSLIHISEPTRPY